MFPLGGGQDLLQQKLLMMQFIKDMDSHKKIIKETDVALNAGHFTFKGWTVLEKQVVMPTWIVAGEQEVVYYVDGRYDIKVNSIKELMSHKSYKEKFCSKVPITSIFGWEGFLWWE